VGEKEERCHFLVLTAAAVTSPACSSHQEGDSASSSYMEEGREGGGEGAWVRPMSKRLSLRNSYVHASNPSFFPPPLPPSLLAYRAALALVAQKRMKEESGSEGTTEGEEEEEKQLHLTTTPSLPPSLPPSLLAYRAALALVVQKRIKEEGGAEGPTEGEEEEACHHTGIGSSKEDEEMSDDF